MDKRLKAHVGEHIAENIWRKIVANGLPPGVPEHPDVVYAAKWKGWCDWMNLDLDNLPDEVVRDLAGERLQ